jgi:aminopeptidase N
MDETHPLKVKCHSTKDAMGLFDGLSYGKGVAFLKQFMFHFGRITFFAGVERYIIKFQYGNVTLDDLLYCFEEAA